MSKMTKHPRKLSAERSMKIAHMESTGIPERSPNGSSVWLIKPSYTSSSSSSSSSPPPPPLPLRGRPGSAPAAPESPSLRRCCRPHPRDPRTRISWPPARLRGASQRAAAGGLHLLGELGQKLGIHGRLRADTQGFLQTRNRGVSLLATLDAVVRQKRQDDDSEEAEKDDTGPAHAVEHGIAVPGANFRQALALRGEAGKRLVDQISEADMDAMAGEGVKAIAVLLQERVKNRVRHDGNIVLQDFELVRARIHVQADEGQVQIRRVHLDDIGLPGRKARQLRHLVEGQTPPISPVQRRSAAAGDAEAVQANLDSELLGERCGQQRLRIAGRDSDAEGHVDMDVVHAEVHTDIARAASAEGELGKGSQVADVELVDAHIDGAEARDRRNDCDGHDTQGGQVEGAVRKQTAEDLVKTVWRRGVAENVVEEPAGHLHAWFLVPVDPVSERLARTRRRR